MQRASFREAQKNGFGKSGNSEDPTIPYITYLYLFLKYFYLRWVRIQINGGQDRGGLNDRSRWFNGRW